MTATLYKPAYKVTLAEDGSTKPLDAFHISPTAQTATELRNHRLLFRRFAGGFHLIAQFDEASGGAQKAPLGGPLSLVFGFWLKELNFFDRYHPDLNRTTGPALLLSNRAANGSAKGAGSLARAATVEAEDGVRISGDTITLRADLSGAAPPTEVSLASFHTPVQALASVPISGAAGSKSAAVRINLSPYPTAQITAAPKPPGLPKTTIFRNTALGGSGATAVLELVIDNFPGATPAQGRAYFAHFRRRS